MESDEEAESRSSSRENDEVELKGWEVARRLKRMRRTWFVFDF
jgi:hypothetical protein